jgi:hypothetical protein
MSKYQAKQENILSTVPSMFQPEKQMLGSFSKVIHSLWDRGSHSRTIAKLHPSIQYDIGVLDYRPQSFPSQASQTAQEASLERMLLRSI